MHYVIVCDIKLYNVCLIAVPKLYTKALIMIIAVNLPLF